MEWLYAFLHKLYEPFNAEDQTFLKTYWDAIFKILLDYHQMDLEFDLDNSLFYALSKNKRFWKGLETQYEEETFQITSVPYRMPSGIKEYKAYGETVVSEDTVALPIDLGSDITILEVTGLGSWTIDGTKILGTGSVLVRSSTTFVSDTTVTAGYLTTTGVTSIVVSRTPYTPVTFSGRGSVLADATLYDPYTDFSSLKIGTQFKIGATTFELASLADKNTAVMTVAIPGAGRDAIYTHTGFEYIIETTAISIPNFDNGLIEDIDYIIDGTYLAFANLPDDILIAERIFFENAEVFAKFGALIGLSRNTGEDITSYHLRVQALWYGLYQYANRDSAALVIHAFLGLPWVTPSTGDLTVTGLETTVSDAKDYITLTRERYDVVSCTGEYFEPSDKYISLADGSAMKIIDYIDSTHVTIDGPAMDVGNTILGKAAIVTTSSITCADNYGLSVAYAIPFGCVSYFGVGDTIPVWSRICTGVRVYDAANRNVDIDDNVLAVGFNTLSPDEFLMDGYTEVAGSLRDQNDRKRGKALRSSVFIVEFDVENVLNLDFINTIKPEHTSFQELNKDSHIGIYETLVVI